MQKANLGSSVQALLSVGVVAILSMVSALTVIGAVSLASMTAGATEDPMVRNVERKLVGSWHGLLVAGDRSYRLVVHIDVSPEGTLQATLDSPDQGVTDIPIAAIEIDSEILRLDIEALGAIFEARLSPDETIMEGEWRQSGIELPLRLELIASND